MGFKADTSFLRFLSMGAAGARQTIGQLRAAGFALRANDSETSTPREFRP